MLHCMYLASETGHVTLIRWCGDSLYCFNEANNNHQQSTSTDQHALRITQRTAPAYITRVWGQPQANPTRTKEFFNTQSINQSIGNVSPRIASDFARSVTRAVGARRRIRSQAGRRQRMHPRRTQRQQPTTARYMSARLCGCATLLIRSTCASDTCRCASYPRYAT